MFMADFSRGGIGYSWGGDRMVVVEEEEVRVLGCIVVVAVRGGCATMISKPKLHLPTFISTIGTISTPSTTSSQHIRTTETSFTTSYTSCPPSSPTELPGLI